MYLNKRQWVAFLVIFVLYLLFGATVFYAIESEEEEKRQQEEEKLKVEIDDLITEDYPANKKHVLFTKISEYCNKPIGPIVPEIETKLTWTFYYSIFFVLTVVSTIGFGGLSPSTPFTRVFTIIYGIIGIPINGIVVITLGGFFGTTFRKIYRRWKTLHKVRAYTTLGLILKLLAYSIPGLAFLIIIPSAIIVLYEDWTFDRALGFAFVTLTTIGTGQYIPGTMQREHKYFLHILYKAYLLVWILMGLGYLAMFFMFIAEGLQSKKMISLERKLTNNIKKTNKRIRKELRFLLNDYLFTETYAKPVYRERRINTLIKHERTQSCPDLLEFCHVAVHEKKRAVSAMPVLPSKNDYKMKSDTDLDKIDKIKTFEQKISRQHHELLIKVVSALANYNDLDEYTTTITTGELNDAFESDEFYPSWLLEKNPLKITQANINGKKSTEVIDVIAFDQLKSQSQREQEIIEYEKYGKTRSRTLPPIKRTESVFNKLKRTIRKSITGDEPNIEARSFERSDTVQDDENNDNSLSDFLRALSIINFNEISRTQKEEESNNLPSPAKVRRLPIIPSPGRLSLNSTVSSTEIRRRCSESCSSSVKFFKDNSMPSTQAKISSWRGRTRSVIGVMQRLKRSTSRHKNSVVINIDQ